MELKRRLAETIPLVDAVVLSDYEYGLMDREIMDLARACAREKIVVGDSRYNLRELAGITLITPNESEAYALAGLDDRRGVEEVGSAIMAAMDVSASSSRGGTKG